MVPEIAGGYGVRLPTALTPGQVRGTDSNRDFNEVPVTGAAGTGHRCILWPPEITSWLSAHFILEGGSNRAPSQREDDLQLFLGGRPGEAPVPSNGLPGRRAGPPKGTAF